MHKRVADKIYLINVDVLILDRSKADVNVN